MANNRIHQLSFKTFISSSNIRLPEQLTNQYNINVGLTSWHQIPQNGAKMAHPLLFDYLYAKVTCDKMTHQGKNDEHNTTTHYCRS